MRLWSHGLPCRHSVPEAVKGARDVDEALERLTWTEHHWRHWLDRGDFPDHRWLPYLQRSALTLKGLTFAPTGAIAAAATTSVGAGAAPRC